MFGFCLQLHGPSKSRCNVAIPMGTDGLQPFYSVLRWEDLEWIDFISSSGDRQLESLSHLVDWECGLFWTLFSLVLAM